MVDCKPVQTPMAMTKDSDSGSPNTDHWIMVKRILRYLQATLIMGYTFADPPLALSNFLECRLGGSGTDRRSTGGYAIFLGPNLIFGHLQDKRVEMAKISIAIVCVAATAWLMASGAMAQVSEWDNGTASAYGGSAGRESFGGACGYGNLLKQWYGLETAVVSTALFNDGITCGACYEIRCYNNSQWCAPGSITVTATGYCWPFVPIPGVHAGRCYPPRKHFDLPDPTFDKLVKDDHAGFIPLQFRRVPCVKNGGIMFEMKGDPDFIQVLVYNVGGGGEVVGVSVKGPDTFWPMDREWGAIWKSNQRLVGHSLSFQVFTSDGKMVQCDNVAPATWSFGQYFEGSSSNGDERGGSLS
ncbi:expansin-A2-like [Elaeis guineensis]|uniref:expansin-A2-like n=1 Tax=Elaeis guineensis var. tenera TaxID=51953 RepID=UPI003C6CD2FB